MPTSLLALPVSAARLERRSNVPSRNARFVGRKEILGELTAAVDDDAPVALVGPGGVGKTSIAVEFAHRMRNRFSVSWWIPAEHPTLARAALDSLHDHLGLRPRSGVLKNISMLLDHLATSDMTCLLIYDNAAHLDSLSDLMPSHGQVLVTSRSSDWDPPFRTVSVGRFARAESVEFLHHHAVDIDATEANELATEVDDHPLALSQISAIQAMSGIPIRDYLELFRHHVGQLIEQGQALLTPPAMLAVLRNAHSQLLADRTAAGAAALQILHAFAYLAAGPIPRRLLRGGRDGQVSPALLGALRNPQLLDQALRKLTVSNLIVVDDDDQTLEMHRLVQHWMRSEPDEGLRAKGLENARAILVAANPGNPEDFRTWAWHQLISPHVRSADLLGASAPAGPLTRQVALDQARFLHLRGDYVSSGDLARDMVTTWSRSPDNGGLGPTARDTLLAIRHYGNALRLLGEYKRARAVNLDAYNRLLVATDFGPRHELTISMGIGVGVDLRYAGDFPAAYEHDLKCLRTAREALGSEHPLTLRAVNSVTTGQRNQGDYSGAYAHDQELMQAWGRIENSSIQLTLMGKANLARDLLGLGRFTEALAFVNDDLLPAIRSSLGSDHDHVTLARRISAICLRKLDRAREALPIIRSVAADSVRQFGHEHEHSLSAAMTLENTLIAVVESESDARLLAEAADMALDTLDRYRRVFGRYHPYALAAACNYGRVLRRQGRHTEARGIDQVTREDLGRVLGPAHPFTLYTLHNLAIDRLHDDEAEVALILLVEAVEGLVSVSTAGHPDTILAAENLKWLLSSTITSQVQPPIRTRAIELFGSIYPGGVGRIQNLRDLDIEPPLM